MSLQHTVKKGRAKQHVVMVSTKFA